MSADIVEMFWQRVQRGAPCECWHWTGTTDGRYGQLFHGKRWVKAHRLSWEIANGQPFPAGLFACHSCDNPRCVNPAHIWPGTNAENQRDAVAKGRFTVWNRGLVMPKTSTHCQRGHPFDEANTLWRKGRRCCRTCQRASVARYDAKRRGKVCEAA